MQNQKKKESANRRKGSHDEVVAVEEEDAEENDDKEEEDEKDLEEEEEEELVFVAEVPVEILMPFLSAGSSSYRRFDSHRDASNNWKARLALASRVVNSLETKIVVRVFLL